MIMNPTYLVTFSSDWQGDYIVFTDIQSFLTWLYDVFEIDEAVEFNTPEFWDDFNAAYENGKWKSFQILTVDWETQTISEYHP